MRRVFFLDLVDGDNAARAYEALHQSVWPEVLGHLRARGFGSCQIFRSGSRLVMLTEGGDGATDSGNLPDKVMEWEALTASFQKPLPWAGSGQNWVEAQAIFDWQASGDNE